MKATQAYLIVEKPAVAYARYHVFCQECARLAVVQQLHSAVAILDPQAYRGTSRLALSALFDADGCTLREQGWLGIDTNRAAQIHMFRLQMALTDDDDSDSAMIGTHAHALEVYALLDAPTRDNYEIIQVSTWASAPETTTLGYDIGYWGGDFFSLICDCAIMPVWHPPPQEALGALAGQLDNLNTSLLFNTVSEAEAFRTYYKAQRWAESESYEGQFCIIRVDAIEVFAV